MTSTTSLAPRICSRVAGSMNPAMPYRLTQGVGSIKLVWSSSFSWPYGVPASAGHALVKLAPIKRLVDVPFPRPRYVVPAAEILGFRRRRWDQKERRKISRRHPEKRARKHFVLQGRQGGK